MNVDVLLSILFELLEHRRTTASYLAEKYKLSPRTVYRYVERLAPFIPLYVKRGRRGGIYLTDNYRLPVGFITKKEHAALSEALDTAYAQTGEEKFLTLKHKLTSHRKQPPVPLFCAEFGEVILIPDKQEKILCEALRILQIGIRRRQITELLLEGEKSMRRVEPVSLLFSKGEWQVYAFCHVERDFAVFSLKSLRGIRATAEIFHPRPAPMYALNEENDFF
jgi:predicted DNA-binding transcriptional regulator YafY